MDILVNLKLRSTFETYRKRSSVTIKRRNKDHTVIEEKEEELDLIPENDIRPAILQVFRKNHKTLPLHLYDDALFLLKRKYDPDTFGGVTRDAFKEIFKQLENYATTFKKLGTGPKKELPIAVLQGYLEKQGYKFNSKVIALIEKLHGDNWGILEFSEFVNFFVFLEAAQEEFDKKDLLKSGALDMTNVVSVLERFSIHIDTPERQKALLAEFGPDKDMTFESFVQMLLKTKLMHKRRKTILRQNTSRNLKSPPLATSSTYAVEIAVPLNLVSAAPPGFLHSPYGMSFTIMKYPWLFLGSGETSKTNQTVMGGPLHHIFTEDVDPDDNLRIVFCGDLMIMNKETPPESTQEFHQLFDDADIIVTNIEAPVNHIERNTEMSMGPADGLDFDMSLEFIYMTFKNMNIDPHRVLAGVANNHAGDKGEEGVQKTQELLSSIGCVPIGAARYNGDPRGALTKVKASNVTLGFVAWTRWMNNSAKNQYLPIFREEDILGVDWNDVKKKEGIDFLIGFVHWDFEQSYIPSPSTASNAYRLLVEQDFDIIVGQGPHVLQTVEIVGGSKVVAYSIGNLCSERGTWQTKMGGLFEINISKKKLASYRIHPYIQEKLEGGCLVVPIDHTLDVVNQSKFRNRLQKLFDLRPLMDLNQDKVVYRVKVITCEGAFAGTDSRVFITLIGSEGESAEMELAGQTKYMFNSGSVDEFYLPLESDLGEIKEVILRLEPLGLFSGWKPNILDVLNMRTNQDWEFPCGLWLDKTHSTRHIMFSPTIEPYFSIDGLLEEMKTGDVIAFEGMALTSAIIKTVTNSPFSHVGIIVEDENEDGKRILCYESTARAFCPDLVHEEWYAGVHLFDLKKRAASYPGRVWWVSLKESLEDESKIKIVEWLKEQHAKKVPFDKLQLTSLGFIQVGFKLPSEEDLDMMFCSEMVASALKHVGLISPEINASIQTPTDVVNYEIYKSTQPHILKSTREILLKKEDVFDPTKPTTE